MPELSREMQVDASGRISMPLVGTVDARNKTADELAQAIERALQGRYVRNPQVTVNIKSSVSQVVTVDGEVKEPGLYPVTNQMTLMRVIASAKGLSEFAKQEQVVILRTVDNQRMAGLYDVSAIRRGAYADPPVYANDVVIIGDSHSAVFSGMSFLYHLSSRHPLSRSCVEACSPMSNIALNPDSNMAAVALLQAQSENSVPRCCANICASPFAGVM
ncbi:polysaccharide biosynthesis/export family protein [Novosphingobium panipatense]|uniref:polysaccharide biosynthesis/export family protein n=1 Tax=Novosphingobium panipatense TaxID=428991 RepID=UPI0036195D66